VLGTAAATADPVPGPGPATPPRAVVGRHLPALDGVRAVAVASVVAFHLGLGWAGGGFLGVDMFFVLSGFLITSLLLEEHASAGRIALRSFWARRARRLLPALFLMVGAVMVCAFAVDRFHGGDISGPATTAALSRLRGNALAALFYVANRKALTFANAQPLSHTWSLSVEEQFYIVWPLVVTALLRLRGARWRRSGLVLCVAGAAASALDMALRFTPADAMRVYSETDTRAFELLAGAALAMVVAARLQPGPRARRALHGAGVPAAVAFLVVEATARNTAPWMYHGGFVLATVLVVVVIADVRQIERGPLARALSLAPLRWLGSVSYGVYLWHWPVIWYCNTARTGLHGGVLDLARVALTVALASASYYLVEQPVRRMRFDRPRLRLGAVATLAATVGVVVATTTPSLAAPERPWTGGGLYPGPGATRAGATLPATGHAPALPAGVTVSAADPLRVLAEGDAFMAGAQFGITRALESTGVVTVRPGAFAGGVLGTPALLDSLRVSVARYHPEVVVAGWSTVAGAPATAPAALRQVLDTVLVPGDGVAAVVLLTVPRAVPGAGALARGLGAVGRAEEAAAAADPTQVLALPAAGALEGAGHDAPTWSAPAGPGGAAVPRGRWVRVRSTDGVDLCPPGITRYAAPVLGDLTALFGLPPARAGWWNSYDVVVRAFDYPDRTLGTCPDDHPR